MTSDWRLVISKKSQRAVMLLSSSYRRVSQSNTVVKRRREQSGNVSISYASISRGLRFFFTHDRSSTKCPSRVHVANSW